MQQTNFIFEPCHLYMLDFMFLTLIEKFYSQIIQLQLKISSSQVMQQFYFLDNCNPFFYCYPSFFNFSDDYILPNSRTSSDIQLQTYVIQPKTSLSITSIQAEEGRKQEIGNCPTLKKAQKKNKSQERKISKRSIIDKIQLQNRNILPNSTNVLLSYIRRINKSGKQVKRALQALQIENLQHAIKRFYAYQGYLKNNVNDFIIRNGIRVLMNYIDQNCSSFTIEDQITFNKVFRIVIIRYLDNDYLRSILTSPKMEEEKRRDHLKVRRYLIQALSHYSNGMQLQIK